MHEMPPDPHRLAPEPPDPFPRRKERRPEPPPDPDGPVTGVAYRPARAVKGRTADGWYPAGEVADRAAGERLRVWLKPVHPWPRVRTERMGGLDDGG